MLHNILILHSLKYFTNYYYYTITNTMSSNLADYIQIMTCSYDLFIKDILMWGKKKILTLKKKKLFMLNQVYQNLF